MLDGNAHARPDVPEFSRRDQDSSDTSRREGCPEEGLRVGASRRGSHYVMIPFRDRGAFLDGGGDADRVYG